MTRVATTLMVDVLVTVDMTHVVVIGRAKPPFMSTVVLPGGHVEESDDSLSHAAARELREETGITVDPSELRLLCILDKRGRDPRYERAVSVVYSIDLPRAYVSTHMRAGSDAKSIIVKSLSRLNKEDMGFDHFDAIRCVR